MKVEKIKKYNIPPERTSITTMINPKTATMNSKMTTRKKTKIASSLISSSRAIQTISRISPNTSALRQCTRWYLAWSHTIQPGPSWWLRKMIANTGFACTILRPTRRLSRNKLAVRTIASSGSRRLSKTRPVKNMPLHSSMTANLSWESLARRRGILRWFVKRSLTLTRH